MVSKVRHSVEVGGDTATMYLSGRFGDGDEFLLNRLCNELPAQVRTIRLDMHALDGMGAEAITAVRSVLRYWRERRGGAFRLSLSSTFLVATYAEGMSGPLSVG